MRVDLLVGYVSPDNRNSDVIQQAVRSAAWHLGIPGIIASTEQALAL